MDFVDLKVTADLPYPETVIPYKNPLEAKKLMNDYGGRDSETTAIMQYIYQAYMLHETEPEIAKKLEEIAVVEMLTTKASERLSLSLAGFP